MSVPHKARSRGKEALPAKQRQYRETPEVADAICRLIRSIGKRISTEDPDALTLLLALEGDLRTAWEVAVAGLRRSGFLDREIGHVLGVSRQAVEQRWPRDVRHGDIVEPEGCADRWDGTR
jgi:hypothetical protein